MEYYHRRRINLIIYSFGSYLSNIFWSVLDLLPHFMRNIIFKIILKKYGTCCMIDYKSFLRYPWKVSFGKNVSVNRGCEFYPSYKVESGLIVLEDNVVLGPNVVIFSAGHKYSSLELPDVASPVIICKDVWVGGNCTILPGVTIGEGAVIGAGSVVVSDIPMFSVAVGNPARVIKQREIGAT